MGNFTTIQAMKREKPPEGLVFNSHLKQIYAANLHLNTFSGGFKRLRGHWMKKVENNFFLA